jgi:hypothetical protein
VDVPDILARLNLPGSSITLRRATRADLPAIVKLLIDDPLGRSREAASEADDSGPYAVAFTAIDTDRAQLLVVATEGIEVVATMQLSFIPGLTRRGHFERRPKRCGSPPAIEAGVSEPPCFSGPSTRHVAVVAR